MKPFDVIYNESCVETLRDIDNESIDCVVTSPPYWGLRDYACEGQYGLEKTPEEYVTHLIEVFREIKRCLKKEGTVWLNLGDSYATTKVGNTETKKNKNVVTNSFKKQKPDNLKSKDLKSKDLVGIPWRVAFALQADGWYLRQDIIWAKPNPMPESVTDRCTKSHEYIFLLTKSARYYFDSKSIQEKAKPDYNIRDRTKTKLNNTPGRAKMKGLTRNDYETKNKRSVWTVTTKPFSKAHFATFPQDLIEPMILAGCPKGGIVYDPFMGAGTTALVSQKNNRHYIGSELNPAYIKIAEKRILNGDINLL